MKKENPIDVSSVPRREPVVTEQRMEEINLEKTRRQWKVVTENLRRGVESDSEEVITTLLKVVELPLTEELPIQFLQSLAERDPVYAELMEKYAKNLVAYLEIPLVPDDELVPDVRHADYLVTPEMKLKEWKQWLPEEEHAQKLAEYEGDGIFLKGVTHQEKMLVLERYKMARDLKLLGLAADIQTSGISGEIGADNYRTKQGVQISFATDDKQTRQDFLRPSQWQRRAVIKDRVFSVSVGNQEYILKEKKTTRHRDTPSSGRVSDMSSMDELKLAQDLSGIAQEVTDDIFVSWERGLAAAEFPDGYQFVLFEKADATFELSEALNELANQIYDHRNWYEEEYRQVLTKAQEIIKDPGKHDLHLVDDRPIFQKFKESVLRQSRPEIPYEVFCSVKAGQLIRRARVLSEDVLVDNDFSSHDADIAYRFMPDEKKKKVIIETVQYDLEYFDRSDPTKRESIKQYRDQTKQGYEKDRSRHSVYLSTHSSIASIAMEILNKEK